MRTVYMRNQRFNQYSISIYGRFDINIEHVFNIEYFAKPPYKYSKDRAPDNIITLKNPPLYLLSLPLLGCTLYLYYFYLYTPLYIYTYSLAYI